MNTKNPISRHTNFFLFLTLIACTWLLTTFKIKTFDLWGMLINGKLWLKDPTLKIVDHLSFSVPGLPYVNQEWLSEPLAYLIYSLSGFTGLITVKTLLVALLVFILWRHMLCRGANVYTIFWILLLTLFICRFRLTVRPQVLSFALIAYLSTQLYAFKIGKRETLWFVVPLMFVWTNLHFGSLIGLILLGTYLLASALALYIPALFDGNLKRPVTPQMVEHLGIVLILSAAACSFNPAGFEFFTMPLDATYLAVKYRVLECIPPRDLPYQLFPLFWTAFIGYTGVIFATIRKIDIFDLLVYLVAAALGLKMVRFIAEFAILAAPVIIQQTGVLLDYLKFSDGMKKLFSNRLLTAAVSFVLVLLVLVSSDPQLKKFQFGFGVNREMQPYAASNFIKTNKLKGNIFNDINWGGFLAFNLHPDNKIFMHGRYTTFGDVVYDTYYRLLSGTPEWEMIFRQYNVDIVMLSKKLASQSVLTAQLSSSPRWHLVHTDKNSMVFIREKPEFKEAIQIFKYKVTVQRAIK